MERTLVVLKPDAVVRGLIGEIIARFEKVGLKVVASKMTQVHQDLAEKHYPVDRTELWKGIGQKTIDNYKELGKNVKEGMGTEDAHEIGKMVRVWLMKYLMEGPVFVFIMEGPHAVELVRKIAGHTLPLKSAPGTIRGDYSFDSSFLANTASRPIKNLLHASGTLEEAKYEIDLWFTPQEIVSYERVEAKAMQ